MFCTNCGKQIEDDAKFCTNCGTAVEGVTPSAPATTATAEETPTATPAPATPAAAGQQIKALAEKNKKILPIAAAVLLVAIIVIVFAVSQMGKISTKQLRADLEECSLVTSGVVLNNQVKEIGYELSSLKIVSQNQEEVQSEYEILGYTIQTGIQQVNTVTFTATITNKFFETEFTGEAYYYQEDGDKTWIFDSATATEYNTTPLQGVKKMQSTSTSYDASKDEIEKTNFTSTLTEEDGIYYSTASQDVTLNFWFATDTYTETSTYYLDPSSTAGWILKGSVEVTDKATEWNIVGIEFSCDEVELNHSDQAAVATLTINSIDDGSINASYSIDYNPTKKKTSSYKYSAVNLSGDVTGSITRLFGEDYVAINLYDEENSVVITGKITNYYDDYDESLYVSMTTDEVYATSRGWFEWTYDLYFTEYFLPASTVSAN